MHMDEDQPVFEVVNEEVTRGDGVNEDHLGPDNDDHGVMTSDDVDETE